MLDQPVELKEGALVRVEVLGDDKPSAAEQRSTADPLFQMDQFAAETGLFDLATNVDHYLYGHPKVTDEP